MPFDQGSPQWTLWQEHKILIRRIDQLRAVVRERDVQRAARSRLRPWRLRLVGLVRGAAPRKALPCTRLDGARENRILFSREDRS